MLTIRLLASCTGNRTGALCGSCREGFSVSILSGACTPDGQCGGDQWFWFVAFLAAILYAMWYTFKDDIFGLFFAVINYVQKPCKMSKSNSTVPLEPITQDRNTSLVSSSNSSTSVNQTLNRTSSPNENDQEDIDKGYFGILTFYVQMTAVIKIQIEFSDIDQSESFLDTLANDIGRFLNIELTQINFDACPIVGLTTLGKHLYKLVFLIGIYLCWAAVFIVTSIIIFMTRGKQTDNLFRKSKSFQLKLVRGIVEIVKYTYAGFCGVIFMSLVCVEIGNNYVWWYDGTHVCLENWQVLIVIFAILYAVPFPFMLMWGLKLLKQNEISAATFICCCLCPLVAIYFMLVHKYLNRKSPDIPTIPLSISSQAIISVLQGPYRHDDKKMTLYWEAMISIRRLLITAMTLVTLQNNMT